MLKHLPDTPLDIIGDVHGELRALQSLLHTLGYNERGEHKGGRRLVFVGDLCDRGPDSFGVIRLVQRIVEVGRGEAILGNHEVNLLRGERKDGNNWFWGETSARDEKYEPYRRISVDERAETLQFLKQLPLVLQRDDLRVVHAAWHSDSIAQLIAADRKLSIPNMFDQWDAEVDLQLAQSGLLNSAKQEKADWQHVLTDPSGQVPLLTSIGKCDELKQMGNPLRVLVSGMERLGEKPFFSSGKWRFAERVKWWGEYQEEIPVVVGHYWRRLVPYDRSQVGKGDPDLFAEISPTAWHGARGNVFCVDYSVGGRYQERRANQPLGQATKLAALRWPERSLVLDTGEVLETVGFKLK